MFAKLYVLLIHLIVSLVLAYLAFSIITKKRIPVFVGVLLGFTAITVAVFHIYRFTNSQY